MHFHPPSSEGDRPAQLPSTCNSQSSFALTNVSFRDLPLLYETTAGSLNIFLNNVFCWIRCHFCISICFRLGTDGRYWVTKGKILVFSLRFYFKAEFLPSNVISARVVETRVSGYPRWMRFVLNCETAVLKYGHPTALGWLIINSFNILKFVFFFSLNIRKYSEIKLELPLLPQNAST